MIELGGSMVRFLVLFFWLIFPWSPLSAAPVASLNSLEGEVSVVRAGVVISSENLTDGFPLEAFDTVSTGNSGKADLRFSPSTGLDGVVRLDSETSLYLDITPGKREQTAGIELLTGAVSIRLSTVTGSWVEVRSEVGSFSGQGPRFRVVGTPGGDVLVLAEAGKVTCRVTDRIVSADSGSMVEAFSLYHSLRTQPLNVSTLESTEAAWVAQRRQAFRAQSDQYFRVLGARYQIQGGLFQRAWDRVQRQSKDGSVSPSATANLRRAAFGLERSLFRIKALAGLVDEGVLSGSIELNRGYTAHEFFLQAARDFPDFSAKVAQARSIYRVLTEASGEFPRASEGLAITWDSDYFN